LPERKEIIAMTNLLFYFLITVLSALLITSIYLSFFSEEYQPRAFRGQENNPLIALYILIIMLIVTAVVLLISKYGKVSILKVIFYMAIALTSLYFFFPILALFVPYSDVIALALGIILAIALYKKPEWYIMNIAGIIVSASAATVLGMSLSVLPIAIFLIIAAVYDFMAVHKTKHMISLADVAVKEKLPVLFVSPKEEKYSYEKEKGLKDRRERESFMMGFGDAVFPSSLAISSLVYLGVYQCLGAIIGSLVGFLVLMYFLNKGHAQPGLPFLNSGALLGMLLAHFLSTL